MIRNCKLLFWQNISWEKVTKYIDNLKSRKYKALNVKTDKIINILCWSSLNSLIEILVALKQSYICSSLELNDFELGYLLFCLHNVNYFDVSFFLYYRNRNCDFLKKILSLLVLRIKYLLIISYLEIHLLYLKALSCQSIRMLSKTDNQTINIALYIKYRFAYCIHLEIADTFNLAALFSIFNKFFLSRNFVVLLSNFFDLHRYNSLKKYLDWNKNFLFLKKNKFFKLLLELLILSFNYELSILSEYKIGTTKINSLYWTHSVLFFCSDRYTYKHLRTLIVDILFFNKSPFKLDSIRQSSYLFDSSIKNFFLMYLQKNSSMSSLIVKPSLQYQFLLMRQISLIIYKSKSIGIFLMTTRLNMLLLLWSDTFIKQSTKKILYIIDYVVRLKLVKLCKSYTDASCLTMQFSQKKCRRKYFHRSFLYKKVNFLDILYHKKFYKFYLVLRLIWIYNLNCAENLREAI